MDHEAETIRQQMEETRASLTEKLETLEQQIVETVQGATSAVTETVENVKEAVHETVSEVKETVHETVDTVKSTFDIRQQVERHPWLVFAGAVAAGFLADRILARLLESNTLAPSPEPPRAPATVQRQIKHVYSSEGQSLTGNGHSEAETRAATSTPKPQAETRQASGLTAMFGDEIDQLKKTAIGATMGLVREFVTETAPAPVRRDLGKIIDRVSAKLGGEPETGPGFAESN